MSLYCLPGQTKQKQHEGRVPSSVPCCIANTWAQRWDSTNIYWVNEWKNRWKHSCPCPCTLLMIPSHSGRPWSSSPMAHSSQPSSALLYLCGISSLSHPSRILFGTTVIPYKHFYNNAYHIKSLSFSSLKNVYKKYMNTFISLNIQTV